jgi:uncharacterized membrane protein YdjX (TVP38/TMEM64 family)
MMASSLQLMLRLFFVVIVCSSHKIMGDAASASATASDKNVSAIKYLNSGVASTRASTTVTGRTYRSVLARKIKYNDNNIIFSRRSWHFGHAKSPKTTPILGSIPAGGASDLKSRQQATNDASLQPTQKRKRLLVWTSAVLSIAMLLYATQDAWAPLLLNKEALQQTVLIQLHRLNELPKISSYTTYILAMALWEAAGLSTIPVETAAGMVFHWNGWLLSAVGKLLGAMLAFLLGRNLIHATIQQQFANNAFLQTIQVTARQRPFLTSLLIKCGPLPETIKNFGSSLLTSIHWWMFAMATILHGWTFSVLWTYLGVDTAMRLEAPELPADRRLQSLLILALVNGVIVSPLSMVYLYKLSGKNNDSSGQKNKDYKAS